MELIRGSYGYDINMTVYDADNNVVDLTGVTSVILNIADIENKRNLLSGACTEVDYTTGQVKYTVQSDDISMKANVYVASLRLAYASKEVETKEFYVTIKDKLSI